MMMPQKFTDEQLTAYLDGELDSQTRGAISAALERGPELQRRLSTLSIDKDQIKNTFKQLLNHAPEKTETLVDKKLFFSLKAITAQAIVLCMCLVIAWSVKNSLSSRSMLSQWQDYAAAYQALYVHSTLAHIDRSSDNMSVELLRVSQALGKNIELNTVRQWQELHYKRAQVLGFEGQVLVQLAFLSGVDAPIALCIMRNKEGIHYAIKLTTMKGMSSALWSDKDYSYILIGGTDDALINRMAQQVSAVL